MNTRPMILATNKGSITTINENAVMKVNGLKNESGSSKGALKLSLLKSRAYSILKNLKLSRLPTIPMKT